MFTSDSVGFLKIIGTYKNRFSPFMSKVYTVQMY